MTEVEFSTGETIGYLVFLVLLLIGSIKLYIWWSTIPTRYPRAFGTPIIPTIPTPLSPSVIQPGIEALQAIDPCNHPYKPMNLDDLYTHCYEQHFEVWNVIGDKGVMPKRWHDEHKREHGVIG